MKKGKKLFGFLLVLDFLAVTCLFLAYGPINYFRDLLVTTAMTTQSHKYLARFLYSDKIISDVLNENVVMYNGDNTNASDIKIGEIEEKDHYDSIYEEQILKRDPNNEDYKILDIEVEGSVAKLAVIYDPSRMSLATSSRFGTGGEKATSMASRLNALIVINSGGFYSGKSQGKGSLPCGNVIKDGQLIWGTHSTTDPTGLIGFNKEHVLVLTTEPVDIAIEKGMMDGMEFGPFLIINGVAATIKGSGGRGVAPRTAIAQRKDGIVLLLIVEGRTVADPGATMAGLIDCFKKYGAYNAANLDGGGSSIMVVENEVLVTGDSQAERYLPTAWMMK